MITLTPFTNMQSAKQAQIYYTMPLDAEHLKKNPCMMKWISVTLIQCLVFASFLSRSLRKFVIQLPDL